MTAEASQIAPTGTERLILPIGHYLGPYHRSLGAPALCHRVRAGREPRKLWSDEQFLAWVLAHGALEELDDQPWTRASVQEHGRESTGLDLSQAVDELLDEGLLIELTPDNAGAAAAFAAAYRLRGLVLGLGQDPAAPDRFLLGLPGQTAIGVPRLGYELWLWGQRTPTLWSACERIAQTSPDPSNGGQGRPRTAAGLLPEVIRTLHPLLAAAVAYLDVVEDAPSTEAG